MIGVVANPSDHAVVREFFELFKTPWEFLRSGKRYDVLLCTGGTNGEDNTAPVIFIFGGQKLPYDAKEQIEIASQRKSARTLWYDGMQMPIYGDSVTFRQGQTDILADEEYRQPAVAICRSSERVVVRVGYDLFREIQIVLTVGQPAANAGIPVLELHIALLRNLIVASGVPLVEIPPVPDRYPFIACLTHDVDHPSIRKHKLDRTMLGFLYRATLGSLVDAFRYRVTVRHLLTNWAAALKLPFVHLGFAKDFWGEFHRYPEIEKRLPSTFFVIPFKNRPGRTKRGEAPKRRASRYGSSDVSVQLRKLVSTGCEIALHGIDAWIDSSKGREELEEIHLVTGGQDIGIRMHWLYFDEQSPAALERAGVAYDSTIGYNETVGYHAGTTQVYKLLQAVRLLELPLHVMDTALFFPCYLDLSPQEASKRVCDIINNTRQFGGCITLNWHDRSIAPERLWCNAYIDLLGKLRNEGAWFSTASQAVSWFRQRRSAVFESISWEAGTLHAKVAVDVHEDLPGLRLRIYSARKPERGIPTGTIARQLYRDITLGSSVDARIAIDRATGTDQVASLN